MIFSASYQAAGASGQIWPLTGAGPWRGANTGTVWDGSGTALPIPGTFHDWVIFINTPAVTDETFILFAAGSATPLLLTIPSGNNYGTCGTNTYAANAPNEYAIEWLTQSGSPVNFWDTSICFDAS